MSARLALGAALGLALAAPASAIPPPLPAEVMRATTIIDGMIRAYDARQQAKFYAFFDDRVEVFVVADRERLVARGKAQLAAFYRAGLTAPIGKQWTRLTDLQVAGDFASTVELSETAAGPQQRSLILYQLSGNKIRRMWLSPPLPPRAD